MSFIIRLMPNVTVRALVAARERQRRAAIEYERAVRECKMQTVIL